MLRCRTVSRQGREHERARRAEARTQIQVHRAADGGRDRSRIAREISQWSTVMAALTFTNSGTDTLIGSTGNDTFTLSDDTFLVSKDVAQGMGGYDKLIVTNQISQLTDDAQFAGVRNIQELDYAKSTTGVQLLNMGSQFAASGIRTIDASLVVNTVQINLSAVDAQNMVITGGTGSNAITGTAHNDLVRIRADTLTGADSLVGGGHDISKIATADLRLREGDVLQLFQDTGTVNITDDKLGSVLDFNTLSLSGKAAFNLTLGSNAQDHNLDLIDASAASGVVKIDASARSDQYEILFSGAGLTATDMVKGTLGLTTLGITDKAALADASFTQVTGVRTIEVVNNSTVADYTGAKIVLGAKSLAAGVNRIVNNSGEELTVDAGARSDTIAFFGGAGKDSFIGTQGQNVFLAGGGDDSLSLKEATLTAADVYAGAAGTDALHILDSDGKTAITDNVFAGISGVEQLVFDATGKQTVTLGGNADLAGIVNVDASKLTGAFALDVTGLTRDIDIIAGSGDNNIKLDGTTSQAVYFVSTKLNAGDVVTGVNSFSGEVHLTDAVKLADTYFATLKTNITNIDVLSFDNAGKGQSLTAGANFKAFQASSTITHVNATTDQGFTFDFSKYDGAGLEATGGAGDDVFLVAANSFLTYSGGNGNDSFRMTSATFQSQQYNVQGQGGFSDEILLLDSATQITDAAFAHPDAFTGVSGVEILRLGATKGAAYDITLGSNAQTAKLTTVDASLAGVDVKIDASALTTERLTVTAGAKNNTLTGGSNSDTFLFDAKTFNASDTVDGGSSGTLGDILRFTTGGVIAAGAFAGTQHIERIFLSDAGNTVTLTDALVASSEGLGGLPALPNGATFDFEVDGGKGADKVDLSALTDASKHIEVIAGLGADTFTGSIGDDTFVFAKDADLTSADVVKGGLGHDLVFVQLGTYGSDIFKGLSSIEEVAFGAFAGTGTATKLTLNNDAFKGSDLNPDGSRDLTIHLYDGAASTVDASGVTSRLNHVTVFLDNVANDTFIGSANADTIGFTDANGFNLDAGDKIDGAGGADTLLLQLTDSASALTDAQLAGVSNVERLEVNIDSGANNKITLGANALAAGITEVTDTSNSGDAMALDATAYTGNLTVTGNTAGSNYDFALGSGNDTVRIISAFLFGGADVIKGGSGTNTLDFVGGGSIGDAGFTKVQKFQDFVGEGGSFDLTLDSNAKATGLSSFDLSHSQGENTVTLGSNFTSGIDITGGDGNDTITGNKSSDMTVTGGSGADVLTGGTGNDTYVYELGSDSFMTDKNDTGHADVIDNFTGHSSGAGDIIDLSAFGLGGGFTILAGNTAADLSAAVTQLQGTLNAFDNTHHVAIVNGATQTFVFVDIGKNDQFDFGSDIAISIVGTGKIAAIGAEPISL
jgi:hypothetical protein